MRLQRFQQLLHKRELDGFLISRLSNLQYLFGFRGSAGMALCLNGEAHLLVDSRYLEQAGQSAHDCRPRLADPSYQAALKALLEELQQESTLRIGIEEEEMSCAWLRQMESWKLPFEFCPGPDLAGRLRRCKEPEEVERIEEALRRAQDAYHQVLPRLQPGMAEIEMAGEVERAMRRHGAQGFAFETIVAGGPRSALPHASASDRIWQEGEVLLIDFGLRRDGYHSDLTRVLLPQGDGEEAHVAAIVRRAAAKAAQRIAPGVKASQVDAAAREHIEAAGYGRFFGHGLGHGLGLDVHESPRVSKTSDEVLEAGMVFTVEPGIYLPGRFGVRIEDVVVVTPEGYRYLSDPHR
ncbi:MAG TPA: aminopeptidase P family protein [Acidobacteriota bacterium]|nr:aminopeptidase P family protein [Acidobacteriota bacterium]